VAAVEGLSIAEIVAEAIASHGLPRRFLLEGVVCVNGDPVPREMWRYVRPRLDSARHVVITLHLPLMGPGGGGGGGGASGKNPIATIALIGVLVAATAISGGLLTPAIPALGGVLFGTYTVAQAVGAGVLIGGSLAIAALIPPPRISGQQTNPVDLLGKPASLNGNVLQPDASIPRVIGTRLIYPPAACEPLNELIGNNEFVECVYVLSGPHAMSDPVVGLTPLIDFANVTVELQEGRQDSPQQTLVQRYGKTTQINQEMWNYQVGGSNNQSILLEAGTVSQSLPQWMSMITRNAPDEVWVRFNWVEGLTLTNGPNGILNQTMRLRFRLLGTLPWINCPEIHWTNGASAQSGAFQKDVRFKFQAVPSGGPKGRGPGTGFGTGGSCPVYLYSTVPGQNGTTITPATSGWNADPYFGTGFWVLPNGTNTGVQNAAALYEQIIFYLDPSMFPPGIYEVQAIIGQVYPSSNFTTSTYQLSSHANSGPTGVYDFFGAAVLTGLYSIAMDYSSVSHRVMIRSLASVYDSNPLLGFNELACIAVVGQGQSLDQIGVTASGYTYDWDGSGWNTFTTTSNPAPHFRDILAGALNADPLPADLIDNSSLVAWRQRCIDHSYTCNLVTDGKPVMDTLTTVAAAGYARPLQSELWGVLLDQDYSAQAPVQVFSPRNMTGFRFEKPFPILPTGFRVRYDDATNNYIENEITVLDPLNSAADTSRLEDMRYDVFVNQADAAARATYDLMQAELRLTYFHGTVDAESLVCRRGDLVAVQHDVIGRQAGFSRVKSIAASLGIISAITVDGSIPMPTTDAWSGISAAWSNYTNAWSSPRTGVAIRTTMDTVLVYEAIPAALDAQGFATVLNFVNPFPDPGSIAADCLVVSGPLDSVYQRLLVFEVQPKAADFTADITFVPEAPQLWGNATGARMAREEGMLEGLALALDAGDGASFFPSGGNVWHDTSGQGNNFNLG
jgi:hypothetical protein